MTSSDVVRGLIDGTRAWLRGLPDRSRECEECRRRNFGRADRLVCLHTVTES